MAHSDAFKKAADIIRTQPLPADAEQRLEELEKRIKPDEIEMFGDLWSAFFMADQNPKNLSKSA